MDNMKDTRLMDAKWARLHGGHNGPRRDGGRLLLSQLSLEAQEERANGWFEALDPAERQTAIRLAYLSTSFDGAMSESGMWARLLEELELRRHYLQTERMRLQSAAARADASEARETSLRFCMTVMDAVKEHVTDPETVQKLADHINHSLQNATEEE